MDYLGHFCRKRESSPRRMYDSGLRRWIKWSSLGRPEKLFSETTVPGSINQQVTPPNTLVYILLHSYIASMCIGFRIKSLFHVPNDVSVHPHTQCLSLYSYDHSRLKRTFDVKCNTESSAGVTVVVVNRQVSRMVGVAFPANSSSNSKINTRTKINTARVSGKPRQKRISRQSKRLRIGITSMAICRTRLQFSQVKGYFEVFFLNELSKVPSESQAACRPQVYHKQT